MNEESVWKIGRDSWLKILIKKMKRIPRVDKQMHDNYKKRFLSQAIK